MRVRADLNDVFFSRQLELDHLLDEMAVVLPLETEGGLVVVSLALGELSLSPDLAEREQNS